MSAHPTVSVIVTARNAASSIGALIDALEAQTLSPERFELIVADDASTDETARLVRERGWPNLIRSPRSLGPARGRNLAAAEARGELLAVTDSDCVPDPDWLERGIAHFSADPDLAMLGGRITITLPAHPSLAALLDAATYLNQEGNVRRGWAVTASMWVRKDVFEAVGGFNERLPRVGEDREFGRCVTEWGGKLAFAADVHVAHPPRRSLGETARKAYRNGRAHAELRRYGRTGARERAPILDPRSYVPRTTLRRMGRLRERGVKISASRRAAMLVAESIFMRAPRIAGDAVGTVSIAIGTRRHRRRRGRPEDRPTASERGRDP